MPKIVWVIVVAMIALLIVVVALDVRDRKAVPEKAADVRMVDPNELLYSLPTLCDALPETSNAPVAADALVLHEDDWRQIEFVAPADRAAIETQLRELHDFKVKHRKASGWDSVFVRKGRDAALAPMGLPSSILGDVVHAKRSLALDSGGRRQAVRGGFAAELGHGVVLYGQEADDKLLSLGLQMTGQQPDFASIEPALQSLCRRAGLDLVDWYGEQFVITASRK